MTYQSDVAPLRRALLKHARDGFVSPQRIADQWAGLGYLGSPDYDEACRVLQIFHTDSAFPHVFRCLELVEVSDDRSKVYVILRCLGCSELLNVC